MIWCRLARAGARTALAAVLGSAALAAWQDDRPLPQARVSGRLMTEDGKPLLNGAIIMSPRDGQAASSVRPQEPDLLPDGTFAFLHVAPGQYLIRARGQTDPKGNALFAVFSVDVADADVNGITMTLNPGAVVQGTLAVESRKGTKPPPLRSLSVRAPFVDGNRFGDSLTGAVQSDGSFALRGLMRGAHQIVIDGLPGPWTLKSVLYRGSDVTDRAIEISGAEQLRDVRITVSDLSGAVGGVVQNAGQQPVADAAVLVFARAPLFWMRTNRRMRAVQTDAAGRFEVSGLPAGEYFAVSSAALDESDLGRPERLRRLQEIAVPFRLDTDTSRATVTLQISRDAGPR